MLVESQRYHIVHYGAGLILGGLWEAPRSTLFNPGYL